MKGFITLSWIVLLYSTVGTAQFLNNRFTQPEQYRGTSSCPEKNGKYPNPSQCDAYIECIDGVPKERLCPDGLVFNPQTSYLTYPCSYPVEVSCEGRSNLQPPQSTDECPRSYGYYRLGDSKNCGHFVNCVAGRGFTFECPLGLAFNEQTLHCDWPDQVASCDAEAYLGFTCPANYGEEYKSFSNQYDCTKYYVCINGRPRLQACPSGTGFSEEYLDCVDIETLPQCAAQQNIPVQPAKSSFRQG
ncbi:hypothetical protein RUM44_012791 [Polyplax serrata]|uniref:Chitin-binding type-2 domain-containing protein n=1 Tax=Polyplax serrata TaxID=468196 RepID=A0ABR1BGN4_POLSC